jgi:ABC-type branched-subunit amino acid transport system ATPase component/ABC-type branched-subunit amino acid transport system permease subunit
MTQLSVALLGLGSGAIIGLLGVCIVATYRGSRFVNFSVGAVAMYVAYVYYGLRTHGYYLIPIPGVGPDIRPDRGTASEQGWDVAPSMIVALATAAGLGVLIHFLVMRPLRSAPAVTKVVATIGILLILQALVAYRFGTLSLAPKNILPSTKLMEIGGNVIPIDRVALAFVAVLAAICAWAVFQRTRFGAIARAAAENERGAILLGVSPQMCAGLIWVACCVLAGFIGILVSPITTLVPTQFSLLIVPALAAALLGRLSSFAVTVAAGIFLGMVRNVLVLLTQNVSWLPDSGVSEVVPLIGIIVGLMLMGRSIPGRGTSLESDLPPVPAVGARSFVILSCWLGGFLLILAFGPTGYRLATLNTITGVIIGLSLVVLTGFVGQLSLFQMALAGVAGYALARVGTDWGVPFPLSVVVASLAAVAVGMVAAIPASRVRGASLAIVTLALGSCIQQVYFNNPSWTGGFLGASVPRPSFMGLDLAFIKSADAGRFEFGLLSILVLGITSVVVLNIRRSGTGAAMLAVRANERAAAACGVNVQGIKLSAFSISAFIAGLGGCLIAFQQPALSAASFDWMLSLTAFALVYLGGVASVSGAFIGGTLFAGGLCFFLLKGLVLDHLENGDQLLPLIGGVGLVLTAVMNQGGIAGSISDAVAKLRRRTAVRLAPLGAARQVLERSSADLAGGSVDSDGRTPADGGQITRPSLSDADPILEVLGLSVSFGGVKALSDVSLRVPRNCVVGLIGPNGAGKTTLVDAISGFVPSRGEVRFRKTSVADRAPHERVRQGLVRTFQGAELFDDLTVSENLQVAANKSRWLSVFIDIITPRRGRATLQLRAERALELSGVPISRLAMTPHQLSLGERKLVGIARALCSDPDVLLLDEPAAGLDTRESRALGDRLRGLRSSGRTILLVDHDVNLVLDVCDYICVLDFGRVIAFGVPQEVRNDPAVIAAYLGSPDGSGAEVRRVST